MTTSELIDELHRRGVQVEAVGDRLRFRPKSAVADLIHVMQERKPELLQALRETAKPARVRGQDAVIPYAKAEPCFHCDGSKQCKCIICGLQAPGMKWKARPCIGCKGSGYVCWPRRIQ